METKLITIGDIKLAPATDTETGLKFSGYGAAFGNTDDYGDVIAPGAFKKSMAAHRKAGTNPLMFLNHDPYSLPIGKWISMEEDEFGLKVEGEFIDTVAGRDTYTAVKAGAITGMSIGYRIIDSTMGRAGTDEPRRTLKSIDLQEISIVTFPANGKARIADVKSFISDGDYEEELARLGMHPLEAKEFIKSLTSRVEAKYTDAARITAASNLLSKLRETHVR